MAISSGVYDNAYVTLLKGEWKWVTGDPGPFCMLLTSGYTVDKAANDYRNDLVTASNEVSGTGYSAGGAQVTAVAPALAALVITCDCSDISWTTATFTANKAVFYFNTAGADSADPLICYVKFGGDVSVSGGTFTITIAAGGLFTITNGAEV